MTKIKTAVILAAGLGSRLKDKTKMMPKGFIEIDGISLIQRSINNLLNAGIEKIVIGTGHHSEYYEELALKIPQIKCKKSSVYASTGSMYTLFNAKELIENDFILLESDLLYDKTGLSAIIHEEKSDVILASGKTFSGDEVYIECDKNNNLVSMSKIPDKLKRIDAELVGITKVSYPTFIEMCKFAETQFETNPKLDYEYVLVAVSQQKPIFVKKIDDYVWCEIDDDNHLDRALTKIYPKIK